MKIDAEINIASLERQIKKVGKRFGDTQEQAIKRWGVHTARDLAFRTQAFGRKAAVQKGAMFKDARKVLFTHEGAKAKTPKGYKIIVKGKPSYVKDDKYLDNTNDIINWIEENRTLAHKRTRQLKPEEKKVCSLSMFKRAINIKHKKSSGTAKDGFLDAGDHIAKRQRGTRKEQIGASYIKWSRKAETHGTSRRRRSGLKTFSELINNVSYTKDSYVLKRADSRRAVKNGAYKVLKWYKYTMKKDAKKKTR